MGQAVPALSLLVSAVSTGASINADNQQRKAQRRTENAQRRASGASRRARQDAVESENRERGKQPDIAAILGAAEQDEAGGIGSTFLTGTGGVRRGSLSLGKKTLLGE